VRECAQPQDSKDIRKLMRDLILAVDQGTQSVRAMIFDLQGQLVAKSQIHIQPYYSRQSGWAEQDCEYFWSRLCEACRNL
jgi:sugar (pentulose or hexulose) kinase